MEIEEAWKQLYAAADLAAMRGSLIFHLDLATEAARTAFTARGIATDALATLVDEDGYRVLAFDGHVSFQAIAEARFDRAGNIVIDEIPDDIPPRAPILAKARTTVEAALGHDALSRWAVIVVPGSDPRAPIEAYAIAVGATDLPMLNENRLLTLKRDGRTVTAHHPLPVASAGQLLGTLTHAGAVPNELHTYLSLKHDLTLLVDATESGVVWRIDRDRTTAADTAMSNAGTRSK